MNNQNTEYLWQRRYDVLLRAVMNRRYHQERRRIFEAREGLTKAASILLGSVAFANIASPEIFKACAFTITACNTAALVFGFGNKARDSVSRCALWAELERDIDSQGERDFSEADINRWLARANEIEVDEPITHARLLEQCHDKAVTLLGGQLAAKSVSWWRCLPPLLIP